MSADRPVAPTPARIARAHAAGLRPPARWLATAACCVALGGLATRFDPRGLGQALRVGDPAADPGRVVVSGLLGWLAIAGVALVAVLLVRIAVGGLGGVDRRAAQSLGLPRRVDSRGPAAAATGLLALLAIAMVISGVVAGAVRGVDASAAGLATLWWTWLSRVLIVAGAGCGLAGLVELSAWRSARWGALHQSVEDARRRAREQQRKAAR